MPFDFMFILKWKKSIVSIIHQYPYFKKCGGVVELLK